MTALDAALERLAGTGPEFGGGLSNHGPMVAEVLWRRGHAADLEPWIERYATRLEPGPDAQAPVSDHDIETALGNADAYAAWRARFDSEMGADGAEAVVAAWLPRLLPGVLGGAFHGAIRVAHGLRAVRDEPTAVRLGELAAGLAYWASSWEAPPATPTWHGDGVPADLLGELPSLPEAQRDGWLITDRARRAATIAGFADCLNKAGPTGDDSAAFARLARAAVDATATGLAEAPIPFIHAVTGPLAVADLVVHADDVVVSEGLRWTWAAVAAVASAYMPLHPAPPLLADDDRSDEALIDDALDCGDEHAIKFADAALRARRGSTDGRVGAVILATSERLR